MASPELPPGQEVLFDVSEYVDKPSLQRSVDVLYEASDKAAHLIMSQMVELIHDRYGPLGDDRSIAHGDDW